MPLIKDGKVPENSKLSYVFDLLYDIKSEERLEELLQEAHELIEHAAQEGYTYVPPEFDVEEEVDYPEDYL